VQSTDNVCFAWSVVAALYPAERNSERELSYPQYMTVLNFNDKEFPMTLKNIEKFERLNDVLINIYNIEEQKVLPIWLTDNKKEKHVNLLYVQDLRDDNVWDDIISRGSKIYPGSWARNWTNIMGKNIFAIGKYAINKKQNFVLKIKNKKN